VKLASEYHQVGQFQQSQELFRASIAQARELLARNSTDIVPAVDGLRRFDVFVPGLGRLNTGSSRAGLPDVDETAACASPASIGTTPNPPAATAPPPARNVRLETIATTP